MKKVINTGTKDSRPKSSSYYTAYLKKKPQSSASHYHSISYNSNLGLPVNASSKSKEKAPKNQNMRLKPDLLSKALGGKKQKNSKSEK